jgi:hypothetical protein
MEALVLAWSAAGGMHATRPEMLPTRKGIGFDRLCDRRVLCGGERGRTRWRRSGCDTRRCDTSSLRQQGPRWRVGLVWRGPRWRVLKCDFSSAPKVRDVRGQGNALVCKWQNHGSPERAKEATASHAAAMLGMCVHRSGRLCRPDDKCLHAFQAPKAAKQRFLCRTSTWANPT